MLEFNYEEIGMSKTRRWRRRVTGVSSDTKTATNDTKYCQQCRFYENKPGRCTTHPPIPPSEIAYTPRKARGCHQFERKA